MSEDSDFRIRARSDAMALSKGARRKKLRDFRRDLLESVKSEGFSFNDEETRVRNEGNFMGVRARYTPMNQGVVGINPYIAMDFFLNSVKMPTVEKSIPKANDFSVLWRSYFFLGGDF